ncbi:MULTISPECIES: TonB-dependent receptor [Flavobacteriaceae]|uniref:TonB-dependent receptor n=1 Tax=Flavobacteriaceae TaxID=49546 RepID=UPI002349809E|nr:TonB-dependent receptor plug domain-containing protein [Muricauda sp. SP22]MDC6361587.1 TonB-dependent receptor plug domain-containing protein [Muricauda sp. SP22]
MKYFMAVCSLFVMGAVAAQDYKGQLVTADGSPLEDAGIFNKTNGQHSHTDGTGHFFLDRTSVSDTIYFSRLGYATQTRVVSAQDLQQPVRIVLNESSISLDQVVLVSEVNALSRLVDVDVKADPVKSSQEILRKVPGLIIGQHAGGGKAEQIFLRGFDVDHGTDVAINVDGMPVNMVSHAHGQGYADLHFVIPETIENVNFGKGPYYMEQGDFNTAGYVDLRLRKSLQNSMVSTEVGQFDTRRFLGMFNVLEQGNSSAYLASELYLTNGPVESPQNFNRLNILGRYRYALPGDQELLLTASHFQSKWDASGQIPQRAVDQGLISRFGSIDDTEGGQTSRTNFVVNHNKNLNDGKSLNTMAFLSHYDFELYSNFTFFLDDPVNGDQIKQYEDRMMLGARTIFKNNTAQLGSTNFKYQAGVGFRYDNVDDNELSHTLNRQELLERLAYGDVDEVNTYAFAGAAFKSGKFTFEPALRLDYFKFDYVNKLSELYDNRSEEKVAFSPKFNTIFSPTANTQFFLKTGMGFHSNDARVVVANQGEDILPTAYGVDLGTILKPVDRLVLNATVWSLFLDQEFVYVGDAGVVEPSGKTRRLGLEVGARYQPFEGLYLYTDANYTHARNTEEADGEDYIPLAPDFTVVGGFTAGTDQGFSGGLNYRYVDDRPANEDNSIVADGYFVTDATLNYGLNNWTFSVIVENLFDTQWNETQFATESRLFSEPSPVEEIHFTPGMPFYLRGKVSLTF